MGTTLIRRWSPPMTSCTTHRSPAMLLVPNPFATPPPSIPSPPPPRRRDRRGGRGGLRRWPAGGADGVGQRQWYDAGGCGDGLQGLPGATAFFGVIGWRGWVPVSGDPRGCTGGGGRRRWPAAMAGGDGWRQ
ncbi:hypothetical protein I4F81_007848 [Pyropia yezoensis]|uniref:Uncharacterized protein n=1 Tax=Pyropia yezoensis TaxID=2788 RepID=A0ACC3C5B8_PYRYE|nr:hypothetical protein I4F81_007848 [Neopyropia yezoensis]